MVESLEDTVAASPSATDPTLAADLSATGPPAPSPGRGAPIARYLVLDKLGEGGMGVVYAAYDPELDRKLALKLLHHAHSGELDDASARLQREAQALAKLNHSNVVAVHDVGVHEGQLFVAMEFVEGQTLGAWMRAAPRDWRELVRVFEEAGKGLAAAHARGLVHRDFKPDNVMLDREGRVRVMDFGLARAVELAAPAEPALEHRHEHSGAAEHELTRTGAIMGTPAYMAPEQFEGAQVDARSDQFSFCVTLFEALYGERPYRASTFARLANAVLHGEAAAPPTTGSDGAKVPRWLRALLRRGLAREPDARFPDMATLLAELRTGEARRKRSRALALLAGLGLLVGGGFGARQWQEVQAVRGCEAAGAQIDALWTEQARTQLSTALLATGISHAQTSAEKVAQHIRANVEAWRHTRTEACLDARVRGVWSEQLHARAAWCLEEQRWELEAIVKGLSQTDDKGVHRAIEVASRPRNIAACRSRERLRLEAPPPEQREAIRAAGTRLAQALLLDQLGRYDEALERTREVRAEIESLGWAPLAVSATLQHGAFHRQKGDYEQAKELLVQAYFDAAKIGDTSTAVRAATFLIAIEGVDLGHPEQGFLWARHAELALASLDGQDELMRSTLLGRLGDLRRESGLHEQAELAYRESLEIAERLLGPEHPSIAIHLGQLAVLANAVDDREEAARLHTRALELQERSLGPEHPLVAETLNNLAVVYTQSEDLPRALQMYTRAQTIWERAKGPEHPNVSTVMHNRAQVLKRQGQLEASLRLHQQALKLREAALAPDHPEVGRSLARVANALRALERIEEATPLFERSLDIQTQTWGPEHPKLAPALVGLALIYAKQRQYARAKQLNERALQILEQAVGPSHHNVAQVLFNLGLCEWRLQELDVSMAHLERALAVWSEKLGPKHGKVAEAQTELARLQLERGELAAARELAEQGLKMRRELEMGAEALADSHLNVARVALAQRDYEAGSSHAERAMELLEAEGEPDAETLAATRFVLAQLLWDAPGERADRARANELAAAAQRGHAELDPREAEQLTRWLARSTP